MSHVALIDQALDRAKLTPRETIVRTLLGWYQDVLNGWREYGNGSGDGLGIEAACRAWNHESYQKLERTRLLMRDREPRLYWQVAERYIRPTTRIALRCPRCHGVEEWPKPGHKPKTHKHGKRVDLLRSPVLVVSLAVDPALVVDGVRWLSRMFPGEPNVPDDLRRE